MEKNSSTEQKIKEAARKVFTRKGYAASRTRDIAEESGLNLALINYYFRSKEKLFEIVMTENIQAFVHERVTEIINNRDTSLPEKIEKLVDSYIDTLVANPDLPLFIMNEIRTNPNNIILMRMGFKERADNSHLMEQLNELKKNARFKINPLHLIMNIMGMIIFPFIASPILQNVGGLNREQFNQLMRERKKLIPMWIGNFLQNSVELKENNKDDADN
jgi:AcrR family transcriptional regulator